MKGEGAIVFLVAFFAFLLATIAFPSIPPGPSLYGLLGVPEADYLVLGIPATTLVIAVLNGVVYGVAAWLIFTFGKRLMRPV
jgi:di/tricarboxylate transporter